MAETWTQWYLVNGVWHSRQVDGTEPSGGRLKWGLTVTGFRVQHLVHDPPGSSPTTTTKPKPKEYQDSDAVAKLRSMDREALHKRYSKLKSELERTKDVYRRTRADAHVLRRNLAKRIRQIEADIRNTYLALYTDEKGRKVHEVYTTKNSGRFNSLGFSVDITFSLDGESFGERLPNIQLGSVFWVYVKIDMRRPGGTGIGGWNPSRLDRPDMISVLWHVPYGFKANDSKGITQDHYVSSVPLHLIREYKAPESGPRTGLFRLNVQAYEFTATALTKFHDEGKQT